LVFVFLIVEHEKFRDRDVAWFFHSANGGIGDPEKRWLFGINIEANVVLAEDFVPLVGV
jgi:hypothetical protein